LPGMEHPINRSIDENDACLPVTTLVVVLVVVFSLYFALRAAVPDLPLHMHHALADLPWQSGEAANALSMLW
jgi:hypothetical protein